MDSRGYAVRIEFPNGTNNTIDVQSLDSAVRIAQDYYYNRMADYVLVFSLDDGYHALEYIA